MANSLDNLDRFYAKNRKEWHDWLRENHENSPGVWLIYYKKNSNQPRVAYDDAVQEALSYGWIDSKLNKLDEERYMQVFTPRKTGSMWSKLNKERVRKLIKNNQMQPAGMRKVEQAKKDGSWAFLDDIDDLIIPSDLNKALNNNPIAQENFDILADSVKKQVLYWIATAKRADTRKRRINKTIESVLRNKNPFE